jgi:hypothetical protein
MKLSEPIVRLSLLRNAKNELLDGVRPEDLNCATDEIEFV